MNFKKLSLIAFLVVAQTAASIPAMAEPVVSPSPSATVIPTPTPSATTVPGTVDPAPASPAPGQSAAPSGSPATDGGAIPTPGPSSVPSMTPPASPAPLPSAAAQPASSAGANQLILMMNSNKMYMNGALYLANQPMQVKNGVSYVSIRAMMERVGLKFVYDYATKETVVTKGSDVMRFKTNSKIYTVNGKQATMKGPAYQYKNTFMVPLTSITSALGIKYSVDNVQKRVILNLSAKPTASFTVQPAVIYAGETYVTYTARSASPNGTPIVQERWSGNKQDIYDQPGAYAVSYSVMDANGEWSDPYTVTINVLKPNQPPVAQFVTDKDEYKMGEMITLTDLSSDPDGDKLTAEWTNRALAFFNPGPVSIQLKVTDTHGATSTFEKTINITGETLYTQEEFNKLFIPAGDIYVFDGSKVPSWPKIAYAAQSESRTLIRSNSPETVLSEGIVYRETAMGKTRLMVHHKNSMPTSMKMYVIATNNNIYPALLTTEASGFGGPIDIPTATGRKSIQTYFESLMNGSAVKNMTIQPGQSVPVLTEISNVTMKPGQVISLMSDVFSDYPLQYTVMMIDASKDPLQNMAYLPLLERDGVHNRGTYPDSTKFLTVDSLVGSEPARLVLGDKNDDPNLVGMDALTGTEASNSGNFGVVYTIRFNRVAPNTLITFNPRGGAYQGPLLVNGQMVQAPNAGAVNAPNQNSVLYRTGDYEQPVEIMFSAASGSNLPVNILFQPLPARK